MCPKHRWYLVIIQGLSMDSCFLLLLVRRTFSGLWWILDDYMSLGWYGILRMYIFHILVNGLGHFGLLTSTVYFMLRISWVFFNKLRVFRSFRTVIAVGIFIKILDNLEIVEAIYIFLCLLCSFCWGRFGIFTNILGIFIFSSKHASRIFFFLLGLAMIDILEIMQWKEI